jgi:hypothetical protein
MLIAGLVQWSGSAPPRAEDLQGRQTAAYAEMHIACILKAGGAILGSRKLELDGIGPALFLSEEPGKNCLLMHNYQFIRPATQEEQATLPVFCVWGSGYMLKVAESVVASAA